MPVIIEEEVGDESELILTLEEGWGRESWDRLISDGVMPLRHVSQTELLVWGSVAPDWVDDSVVAPPAEWRGEEITDSVRILIEPRLPFDDRNEILKKIGDGIVGPNIDGLAQVVSIHGVKEEFVQELLYLPGILWIEPILETMARNSVSASTIQGGDGHQLWNLGFNGSGVVVTVADTGIDLDHSCFRDSLEAVGEVGPTHRKIVLHNTTIDDWDHSGQADFRHGTHVAGTLVCNPITEDGSEMLSISNGAKLVVQDVVGENGWEVPPVAELLQESASMGSIINSYSWGDDTVNYTARSGNLDAWSLEVPYSLVFVAPGNDGSTLMEPANARNVVAVGATNRNSSEFYPWSSHGETPWGARGIMLVAPGVSVKSAKADGLVDSLNSGSRSSSGTSMATPMAAGAGAVVQQMIGSGYIAGSNQSGGAVPSGSLLRALLSLASSPMYGAELRGEFASGHPDHLQGFGALDLSILDNETWIHDSYQMEDWQSWYNQRSSVGLSGMVESPWDGSGASGPFLKTGDVAKFDLILEEGKDLQVRLAFPSKPQPTPIDDLQLVVKLQNGSWVVGGIWEENYSVNYHVSDDLESLASINETVVGVRIPYEQLSGQDRVVIEVRARNVYVGNSTDSLGVDGDSVGFALAASGVVRNPWEWSDDDSDDVLNENDECLDENSIGFDVNKDGCIDDLDLDGVKDNLDLCLDSKPWQPILDDGCPEQNIAPVISVYGPISNVNYTDSFWINWSVQDIDPVEVSISLEGWIIQENVNPFKLIIDGLHCTKNSTGACEFSIPNDMGPAAFNSENWTWSVVAVDKNNSNWTVAKQTVAESDGNFTIWWEERVVELYADGGSESSLMWIVFGGFVLGILLPMVLIKRRERGSLGVPPPYFRAQDDSSVESASQIRSPKAEGEEDE